MNRKIPTTMVSQHPDHAGKPYWHNKEYISTQHEGKECFLSFSDLGVTEYKWDWEGKLVEEAVIERLFGAHLEYFKKHPLGKDRFLTFRLPNPKVETEFRLGRAFMGMLAAAGLAKKVGLHSPPLFEVILPMTESAEEMIEIQTAFREVASLKNKLYNLDETPLKHIELIPLFEQVDVMIDSDTILEKYFLMHKKKFDFTPKYIRPYLARSDPALNSGLIPTVLAIKIALSRYKKLEKKIGIRLFPIIGSASLPFRGGLTPYTVKSFCTEYRGIRTALLQSAFRYDYPKDDVLSAIRQIGRTLPRNKAVTISSVDENMIIGIIPQFEHYYRDVVEANAHLINTIASQLPKRRERVQHIGLFGYSRNVGKVKLPRAIGFTGSLYSLGIPPEFIGTGRSLKYATEMNAQEYIKKLYVSLKSDLVRAGHFLHKDNLKTLASMDQSWNNVLEDVEYIERHFAITLGPKTDDERMHGVLAKEVLQNLRLNKPIDHILNKQVLLRKSVG